MEFPAYQNSHTIRHILRNHRRVAMVGLSANESRPSFFVGYYLQRMGFEVIPVNPRYERILGQNPTRTSYPYQSLPTWWTCFAGRMKFRGG